MIGKYVLVRTESAGVHMGFLKAFTAADKFVMLTNARRIWSWSGANTLSEISLKGVSTPSRISDAVETICLLGVIEVILVTPEAKANLDSGRWE